MIYPFIDEEDMGYTSYETIAAHESWRYVLSHLGELSASEQQFLINIAYLEWRADQSLFYITKELGDESLIDRVKRYELTRICEAAESILEHVAMWREQLSEIDSSAASRVIQLARSAFSIGRDSTRMVSPNEAAMEFGSDWKKFLGVGASWKEKQHRKSAIPEGDRIADGREFENRVQELMREHDIGRVKAIDEVAEESGCGRAKVYEYIKAYLDSQK